MSRTLVATIAATALSASLAARTMDIADALGPAPACVPSGQASAVALPIGTAEPLPDIPSDWSSVVQRNVAVSEYRPSRAGPSSGGGLAAPNRAQGFRTRFTNDGIVVTPRTHHAQEAPAWTWGLSLQAIGRRGAMTSVGPTEPVTNDSRVEYRRGGPGRLVEWYVNDARGLEQGFTLEADPAPGDLAPLVLEMAVAGDARAHAHTDAGRVEFLAPAGALVIRLDALRAFDATNRELPCWFEVCDEADAAQSLAIVVDDAGAAYPVTIDPLATSPSWTAEGDQDSASFGVSVSTAGDVNGDGFSDVIVGAAGYDAGSANEGRAFVYHGSPAGLSMAPAWIAESNQVGAGFGLSVCTAGDVNGDGYSDVIVGAYQYNNGQSDEGRAYVFHGSASGLSATPAWTAEGDQVDAWFGYSVATAGDIDGDGYGDVIVGAHNFDNDETDEGRAYVYHGSASGLSATPAWTAEGDQADAYFGLSVSTAGDVNGDGYGDVVVGARSYSNGEAGEGRAYAYHGSASGLSVTLDWTVESDQVNARFGVAVSTAGDVNGDGFSDVIVGAYLYDDDQTDEGRAYVYHGSTAGLSATPDWVEDGDQEGAGFGISVRAAGDVNGDGYGDVIVGAYLYDHGEANEGRATVYHGSTSGLPLAWKTESDQADAWLGYSVCTAGDVDGDGFSDVIVGTYRYDNGQTNEGRALVYRGSASGVSWGWTAVGDANGAKFGRSVSTAGDVNGDGFGDVIVGAPGYFNGIGQAFVYHGSAEGLSAAPDWAAQQISDQFGAAVSTAGDVNGDGYGDVIVGVPLDFEVSVYYGSPAGLSATPAVTIDALGLSLVGGEGVSTAGDVNGDGYGDVIVGEPYGGAGNDLGRAVVFHGSALGLATTPAWTFESDQEYDLFGFSVRAAGDVDGDGYGDVIVGAPNFDSGQVDKGRAFVYHGSPSGLSTTPAWIAEGDFADWEFGYSVSAAGDVNGDGFGDVVIGAPRFSLMGPGYAYVYLGSPSGLAESPAWSSHVSQGFGRSVSTAGDVNGDGYCDVIIADDTATGAFAFVGSADGSLSLSFTFFLASAAVNSVSMAGDVNGDGYGDVIVGMPDFSPQSTGRADVFLGNYGLGRLVWLRQRRTDATTPIAPLGKSDSETQFRIRSIANSFYGRTRIALQHQVKPLGELFDDTGIVEGGYFDIGDDGFINFSRLVSGLTPGTPYHWRIRARYDTVKTPFQKYGPWYHIPSGGWNETDLWTAGDPPPPPIPGDLDGDGMVNGADLGILLGNWGSAGPIGDINGDGIVNGADLGALLGGWGGGP